MTAAAAAGRRCVEILISNAARRSIIYNSLSIHKEGKDITGPSIYICNAAGIGCHRRRYGDSRTRGGFLRRRDGIKRLDFFIISFHFVFFSHMLLMLSATPRSPASLTSLSIQQTDRLTCRRRRRRPVRIYLQHREKRSLQDTSRLLHCVTYAHPGTARNTIRPVLHHSQHALAFYQRVQRKSRVIQFLPGDTKRVST